MELLRIKNNTLHDQYVIYKGTQVILSPEEERTVEKGLGDLFLQKCPGHVSEVPHFAHPRKSTFLQGSF